MITTNKRTLIIFCTMTMFFVDANLEIILNEINMIRINIQIVIKLFLAKIRRGKKPSYQLVTITMFYFYFNHLIRFTMLDAI